MCLIELHLNKILLAVPLFPTRSPQRMDLHISFGTDFIPNAVPDATLPSAKH